MCTRNIARTLNAVTLVKTNQDMFSSKRQKQSFDYLLVLDFEATCWDNTAKDKGPSEIIEFPVVLYDVKSDKMISEFHEFVKPFERPILSSFCTELTGITQSQVDNGISLENCLTQFTIYINDIKRMHNIEFPSANTNGRKKCAFATWSDWDLGTCFKNECKRKHLERNDIFHKWIDVKKLYKNHYRRQCKGLNGALHDVGLQFEGRQHSGLHDARNTVKLISRMVDDGVTLQLTRGANF